MTALSLSTKQKYGSLLAGNPAGGNSSYWLISRTTVGSSGASSITFSSIPSTYSHLQIRGIIRSDATGTGGIFPNMRFNNDSANNYARHNIGAFGSTSASTDVNAGSSNSSIVATAIAPKASDLASAYGAFVIDILDYASTNKYKTSRYLMGLDLNGNAYSYVYFGSGLWQGTSAINQIDLILSSGNFTTYSSVALYGIKGA